MFVNKITDIGESTGSSALWFTVDGTKAFRSRRAFSLNQWFVASYNDDSDAESYLDLALKHLKPKGIIHLYTFIKEENFKKLKEKYSKKFKVKLTKAGTPAPGKYRVCLDLQS